MTPRRWAIHTFDGRLAFEEAPTLAQADRQATRRGLNVQHITAAPPRTWCLHGHCTLARDHAGQHIDKYGNGWDPAR